MNQEQLWKFHCDFPKVYEKLREEAAQELDEMTPVFCVCGKLASGFHTMRCRDYQERLRGLLGRNIQRYITQLPQKNQ